VLGTCSIGLFYANLLYFFRYDTQCRGRWVLFINSKTKLFSTIFVFLCSLNSMYEVRAQNLALDQNTLAEALKVSVDFEACQYGVIQNKQDEPDKLNPHLRQIRKLYKASVNLFKLAGAVINAIDVTAIKPQNAYFAPLTAQSALHPITQPLVKNPVFLLAWKHGAPEAQLIKLYEQIADLKNIIIKYYTLVLGNPPQLPANEFYLSMAEIRQLAFKFSNVSHLSNISSEELNFVEAVITSPTLTLGDTLMASFEPVLTSRSFLTTDDFKKAVETIATTYEPRRLMAFKNWREGIRAQAWDCALEYRAIDTFLVAQLQK